MLVADCFSALECHHILFMLNILLDNQNIVFVSGVFVLLSLCIFVAMSVTVHGEVTCLSDNIDIEFAAVSHELFNTSSPSLPAWATNNNALHPTSGFNNTLLVGHSSNNQPAFGFLSVN